MVAFCDGYGDDTDGECRCAGLCITFHGRTKSGTRASRCGSASHPFAFTAVVKAQPLQLYTFYFAGGPRRLQRTRRPSQALQQVLTTANCKPPTANTLAATSAFTTSPWYRPQRAPPLALQCNLLGFCCVCVLRAFSLLRQDMYFGTCTDNRTYEVGAHVATLQRAADADGHDVFVFTPRQTAAVAGVQSQETTK